MPFKPFRTWIFIEELQRFWLQEEVTSASPIHLTPAELECEEHFRETHSRDDTERYIVRLPAFRSTHQPLGNSRNSAIRSLERVRQRIHRDPSFDNLYFQFMREYEELGHMRRTSTSPYRLTPTYLPHHDVLRESSSTTKLRVVFSGSSRTTTGFSLNDTLHPDPKLQQDIDAVLLRWRTHVFVFAADIEKMYRQILIHPEDRDYQRIFWSQSGPPLDFQLCTVTYSLTCAPYLALRVLQQLASDEEKNFPQATSILRKDTYVDDILSGADFPQDAQDKATQLNRLLMASGSGYKSGHQTWIRS